MNWLNFIKKTEFLDVSSIFSVPYTEILREIAVYTRTKSLAQERNFEKYQKLQSETIAVAEPISGHDKIQQERWRAIALFAKTDSPNDNITQGFTVAENKTAYQQTLKNLKFHRWTTAAAHFPKTREWIEQIWGKYLNLGYVKISCLKPMSIIPPHSDYPIEAQPFASQINSYNVLNSFIVSLKQPKHCLSFHGEEDKVLPHVDGSTLWLNQSHKHWVVNGGQETRWTIRIHGMYKKPFKRAIENLLEGKPN